MLSRALSVLVVGCLMTSALAFIPQRSSESQLVLQAQAVDYPYAEYCNLWIRKNGSDPGFPFPYANRHPTFGMNYFGTNNLLICWDYNLTEVNSSALFPLDCYQWLQTSMDPGYATNIANAALTNDRIMGAFIDDFKVGQESDTNMSAVYDALHANDEELERELTLYLIVYQYNYNRESPYTWDDIDEYFDGINFWFYPKTYPLLFPELIGYEDSFRGMKALVPDKDYWMGIYLHYYNIGDYPITFTYDQLRIASRLMAENESTKLSILENFWILNNPETAELVRDYIVDEMAPGYETTITGAGPSTEYISYYNQTGTGNYTFYSHHLQTVSYLSSASGFVAQNLRTGEYLNVWTNGSYKVFVCEPNEWYLVKNQPMTAQTYSATTYLNTNTTWQNKAVYINATIFLNATLTVIDSTVRWGNNGTDTMKEFLPPAYGLIYNSSGKLYVKNSTFEPLDRNYAYYINGTWPILGTKRTVLENSMFVGLGNRSLFANRVWMNDTRWFGFQPNGQTYWGGLWFFCPGTFYDLHLSRNHFWNYYASGMVSLLIQPSNLQSLGHLTFQDNVIIGGDYGLWIDGSISQSLTSMNNQVRPVDSNPSSYTQYRIDRGSTEVPMTLVVVGSYPGPEDSTTLTITTNNSIKLTMSLLNTTKERGTAATMSINFPAQNRSATITLAGMRDDYGYQVFINGSLVNSHTTGKSMTWMAYQNGTYDVVVWGPKTVTSLIMFTINMVLIGIMVTIAMSIVLPMAEDIKRKRSLRMQKYSGDMIRAVIFVVIALVMWTLLKHMFIGG